MIETGHRDQRNDRCTPRLQEENDDEHHKRYRFEQRMDHRLDRGAHELRRVVHDAVVNAFGHVLLQLSHRGADVVRDLDGVRAGRLEDRDSDGLLVVEQRAQRVIGGTQLDARDIAQSRDLIVRSGFDDDVAEFLFGSEAALGIDRKLKSRFGSDGDAPTTPTAACTFSARTALTMSLAESPSSAAFAGSTQTRIE